MIGSKVILLAFAVSALFVGTHGFGDNDFSFREFAKMMQAGGDCDDICQDLREIEKQHSETAKKIEQVIEKHRFSCPCVPPSQDPRGWVKVGELDMTQPDAQCPADLKETTIQVSGKPDKRVCSRSRNGIQCFPVPIPVNGKKYSRVSGRVRAYQGGTPNAFGPTHFVSDVAKEGINAQYVDGVSITTISGSQRSHVWTFAASGGRNGDKNGFDLCPCEGGTVEILDEIGSDYFCDAASNDIKPRSDGVWYTENPLWDGVYTDGTCTDQCCTGQEKPGPEFCKTLSSETTEDLELRLCINEKDINEDIGIESFEIYIQ